MLSVGIDIAEEVKGLDVVALDRHGTVRYSRGRLSVTDALDEILELEPSVVCIDGPSGWSTSGKSRQAERDLRRLGISSFATGPDPGDHPFYAWMRVGFRLFHDLAESFPLYRGGDVTGRAAEVFPAASAFLLAGELRPSGETKVRFRRRVLHDVGIDDRQLPNIDRVDAALAAVTGLHALKGRSSWLGDPDEGVVLLPTPLPAAPLTSADSGAGRQTRRQADQVPVLQQACECGCGALVRRRFLPGHDAKLKSALRKEASQGDHQATERLRALRWS